MEKRTKRILSRAGIAAPLFAIGIFSFIQAENDIAVQSIACSIPTQTDMCDSPIAEKFQSDLTTDAYFLLGIGILTLTGAAVVVGEEFLMQPPEDENVYNKPNQNDPPRPPEGPFKPRDF